MYTQSRQVLVWMGRTTRIGEAAHVAKSDLRAQALPKRAEACRRFCALRVVVQMSGKDQGCYLMAAHEVPLHT